MMRVVRRVLLTLAVILCFTLTLLNIYNRSIDIDGSVRLAQSYAQPYYEALSDNVGITTINGISNVFINMKVDGYSIYKQDMTQSYIDVSFIKSGAPSYRFYFLYPEGKITFFSSEYENSYIGVSYINDKKE